MKPVRPGYPHQPIQVHATGPIYVLTSPHGVGPGAGGAHGRSAAFSKRLQTLLLAALAVVSLMTFFEPRVSTGTVMDSLGRKARAWAPSVDTRGLASVDLDFPVQSCCVGQLCLTQDRGRYAIVTSIHSDRQIRDLQVRDCWEPGPAGPAAGGGPAGPVPWRLGAGAALAATLRPCLAPALKRPLPPRARTSP